MTVPFSDLKEINRGLSKKKIFRKFESKLNKIIIDFSHDKKEFINFLNVYEILKKINISIPRIYEVYSNDYVIVMEDFGDDTFDKIFHKNDIYSLLKLAIDNLIIIQNSTLKDHLFALLFFKMYYFKNHQNLSEINVQK